MTNGNDAREVVAALAAHEDTMSALYRIFADQYPHASDLWLTMSREEHRHGRLLRSLAAAGGGGLLLQFADRRRYDLVQITGETRRLNAFVQAAPSAGFGLGEAFRSALEVEDRLIASEVLLAAAGDPPEVAGVLDVLREQTERHREHLAEAFFGKAA